MVLALTILVTSCGDSLTGPVLVVPSDDAWLLLKAMNAAAPAAFATRPSTDDFVDTAHCAGGGTAVVSGSIGDDRAPDDADIVYASCGALAFTGSLHVTRSFYPSALAIDVQESGRVYVTRTPDLDGICDVDVEQLHGGGTGTFRAAPSGTLCGSPVSNAVTLGSKVAR